eukprot:m.56099 g.56099  ORF g.56099 m.56099 type:complete len:908 (+) comp34550_c0_seq2:55-2778(+)
MLFFFVCFALMSVNGGLNLSPCSPPVPGEYWRLSEDGSVKSAADASSCLTAVLLLGHYGRSLQDRNLVVVADCRNDSTAFLQQWKYSNSTLALASNPEYVLQSENSAVFVNKFDSKCGSSCQWQYTNKQMLMNGKSNMCLDATSNRTRTCEKESPSYSFPFCNSSLSLDERLDDLAKRVTIDEKILQLNTVSSISPEIPHLSIPAFWWDQTCIHGIADDYDMSRYAIQSELASYVTIFPHAIAQAASFDIPLIRRIAKATADEARALHQRRYTLGYSDVKSRCLICNGGPLANLVHDPRWGRTSETYGEDPFVISRFASEYTKYLQNSLNSAKYLQTISVIRHFSVFSGPTNEGSYSSNITLHDLVDSILPGFQATVLDGKAMGMMCDYGAVNGTPGCANEKMMADVLRRDWGYPGYVTDDWGAVDGVYSRHHFVNSSSEAVAAALKAGVNILYHDERRTDDMRGLVANSTMFQSLVEDSFKLLFTMRMKLGEFDPEDDNPYAQIPQNVLDSTDHRALAKLAAQESMVLLHNVDKTLPLCLPGSEKVTKLCNGQKVFSKIAVIGPAADAAVEQYTHSYSGLPSYVVTPFQGIRDAAESISKNNTTVAFEKGCDINSQMQEGFAAALDLAKSSDVVIYVGGLSAEVSREGLDRKDLLLPGVQSTLLQMLSRLGKPVVVCLINGAPLSLSVEGIGAIVEAWYGGQETGSAIADVLFGVYNPGGKLPLTFFDKTQELPGVASYDFTNPPGRTYRYFVGKTQWTFGYGLSYTIFNFSEFKWITPSTIDACDPVSISVSVTNTGPVDGSEVAQLYVTPPSQEYKTPKLSLQGFERVFLKQGESQIVEFTLEPYLISLVDGNARRVVPSGVYSITIGGRQAYDTTTPGNTVTRLLTIKGNQGLIGSKRECQIS